MKNLKKDNKGFSLVELIVVVLIMAIIAVALAPQILKWVNNSRISSDVNTMQTLVGNAQVAMANEKAYAERTKGISIKVDKTNGCVVSGTSLNAATSDGFLKKFYEVCGVTDAAGLKKAYQVKQSGDNVEILVSIDANAKVTGKINNGVDSVND